MNEVKVIADQTPKARQKPNTEGVLGLIGTGVAVVDKLILNTPYKLVSFADLETLGIDADYDADNDSKLYKHLTDIYTENPRAVVWLMVVSSTVSMAQMASSVGNYAPALLDASNNAIRILGFSKYTAVAPDILSGEFDSDVSLCLTAAQILSQSRPLQIACLIEGCDFTGDTSSLENLRTYTNKNCAVVLGGDDQSGRTQNIGEALGRLSAIPVNINITRDITDVLKPMIYTQYYFGTKISNTLELNLPAANLAKEAGYIVPTKLVTIGGTFWDDDPTAVDVTNPYSQLTLLRVAMKAEKIILETYERQKNKLAVVTATGRLTTGSIKSFESLVLNNLIANMLSSGVFNNNVSLVDVYIDEDQDVLNTGKLLVNVTLTALAVIRSYEVTLAYS